MKTRKPRFGTFSSVLGQTRIFQENLLLSYSSISRSQLLCKISEKSNKQIRRMDKWILRISPYHGKRESKYLNNISRMNKKCWVAGFIYLNTNEVRSSNFTATLLLTKTPKPNDKPKNSFFSESNKQGSFQTSQKFSIKWLLKP